MTWAHYVEIGAALVPFFFGFTRVLTPQQANAVEFGIALVEAWVWPLMLVYLAVLWMAELGTRLAVWTGRAEADDPPSTAPAE